MKAKKTGKSVPKVAKKGTIRDLPRGKAANVRGGAIRRTDEPELIP